LEVIGAELAAIVLGELIVQSLDHGTQAAGMEVIGRASLVESELLLPDAQRPIGLDELVVMSGESCYQMFSLMNVLNHEVEGRVTGASSLMSLGQ
jgi:hypothetical protein